MLRRKALQECKVLLLFTQHCTFEHWSHACYAWRRSHHFQTELGEPQDPGEPLAVNNTSLNEAAPGTWLSPVSGQVHMGLPVVCTPMFAHLSKVRQRVWWNSTKRPLQCPGGAIGDVGSASRLEVDSDQVWLLLTELDSTGLSPNPRPRFFFRLTLHLLKCC